MIDQSESKTQSTGEGANPLGQTLDLGRKQSNDDQLPNEQDIQMVLDNIPSVVWVMAREDSIIFISDNVKKVYGYTPSELLAASNELWFDHIHPDDRPQVREALALLFSAREDYRVEYRIQRKDGEWLWILDRANIVAHDNGQLLAYGVFTDITEHKQMEEAYRVLVTDSLQGLIIFQGERVVFVNPAAEEVTGYSSKELMDMENPLQTLIHPDDLPARLERAVLFERNESFALQSSYRIIVKNGQVRWLETYTMPIDWKGKPAVHATFIDVTDRKIVEEKFQRISQVEDKRREELEKLREISANMRKAEGSSDLLQVFTMEVQKLCQADIASSIFFKARQEPLTYIASGSKIKLNREQSKAIFDTLSKAEADVPTTKIPGFASALTLQLQSSETVYGAVLVASQAADAFNTDQQNMLNATADMAGTALQRIDILESLEERVQQRTHDLVVLYNLITIISENWRLQDLLELSLVLTLETVKANRGIIYLVDGKDTPGLKPVIQRGFGEGFIVEGDSLPSDDLARQVLKHHKSLALENLAENPAFAKTNGLNSYAGIPILVRGDMRGVFSLFAAGTGVFDADTMALLASIADHLGIGIENSILWEKSHESAALEERNRLARNLHDSVSQLLYSLTLMAWTTRKMLDDNPDLEAVKKSVTRLGDTAQQALKEMRLLLYELRPAVLDSEGIVNALQHRIATVEERLGIKVVLQAKELPELPSDMEDALYHIALEALNNIVKHAKSTTAKIKVGSEKGKILMEIRDNGSGFDPRQPHPGQGLRNMRERVQMLGGEVQVDSQPGNGTCITIRLKLPSSSLISS